MQMKKRKIRKREHLSMDTCFNTHAAFCYQKLQENELCKSTWSFIFSTNLFACVRKHEINNLKKLIKNSEDTKCFLCKSKLILFPFQNKWYRDTCGCGFTASDILNFCRFELAIFDFQSLETWSEYLSHLFLLWVPSFCVKTLENFDAFFVRRCWFWRIAKVQICFRL